MHTEGSGSGVCVSVPLEAGRPEVTVALAYLRGRLLTGWFSDFLIGN